MDIFISLMCRRLSLYYEQETQHAGIRSFRYIPKINALGSHDDANETLRNEDNSCYCVDNFDCYKSGVFNMAPCKTAPDRPGGAPIALSFPHFYQADPSYLAAIESGLNPTKEKHEYYVDILPEYGFPLAFRPRFQLNAVLRGDPAFDIVRNFTEELILPFLWAEDGYSEPSRDMADKIKMGLGAPDKIPKLGGIALIALGGLLLLTSLVYFLWSRNSGKRRSEDIAMS